MRNNQREEITKQEVVTIHSISHPRGSAAYNMVCDSFFNSTNPPIKKAKNIIKFKNHGDVCIMIGTTGTDSLFEALLNDDLSNTVESLKDTVRQLHIPENAIAMFGPFSRKIYNDKDGFAYVSLSSIDGVFYRVSKI